MSDAKTFCIGDDVILAPMYDGQTTSEYCLTGKRGRVRHILTGKHTYASGSYLVDFGPEFGVIEIAGSRLEAAK